MLTTPGSICSYPEPRSPGYPTRAISHCPTNATAGPVSSSQPWALLSWAYVQAHVLASPQPLSKEMPSAQGWGCPSALAAYSWLVGQALAARPGSWGTTSLHRAMTSVNVNGLNSGVWFEIIYFTLISVENSSVENN